jgi:arylsulfatase A-like enzyme
MAFLDRLTARGERSAALLPWLVAAALAVWLKFRVVSSDAVRESALGLRPSGVLTGWEKAALLRWDVALGLVLIPIALIVAGLVLPRWARVALSTVLALVAAAVLIVQESVRAATGGFTSFGTLARATDWALRSRDTSLLVMPAGERIVLPACVVLVVVAALAAAFASERWLRRMNVVAAMVVAAGVCAAMVLFVVRAPAIEWRQPMLLLVARAAVDATPAVSADGKPGLTLAGLRSRDRELAQLPDAAPSPWAGKAQGYNVVFFVLETAPAVVFDPARDSLRDMPNARRLRQNSFVATSHFSTLPLSSSALFSLFTSTYARGADAVGASLAENVQLPGMIRDLNAAGYETGYYGFVWKAHRERDDRMFASLGFKRIVESNLDEGDLEGKTTFKGPIEYVERHDRELLAKVLNDIHEWSAARQKFAAVFFPQLGHDPWRAPKGSKAKTLLDRGHALAVYQDAWLGELLAELERDGALDRTMVVLTSDHGLRTTEDPEQKTLRLVSTRGDDIMIRVPLLIWAPRILTSPERIEWPTSHIDLAPTILDLLAVPHDPAREQGMDIWNPGLRNRRLFLAMDFFGVQTGFSQGGEFYMRSRSQTVFKSTRAHFEDGDALLQDSQESALVRKVLDEHDRLQQALLTHMFRGDSEPPAATSGRQP